MTGDMSAFADCVAFPFELVTASGRRVLEAPEDLTSILSAMHNHLQQMGVTILARHCVAAEYRTPDEIVATHETRLISNGLLIEDPFPTLSVLIRTPDGAWKIRSSSYDVPRGSIYESALDA